MSIPPLRFGFANRYLGIRIKYFRTILFILFSTYAASANATRCLQEEYIDWKKEYDGVIMEAKLIDKATEEYIKQEVPNVAIFLYASAKPQYRIFVQAEEKEENLIVSVASSRCDTNFMEFTIGQEVTVLKYGEYQRVELKKTKQTAN